ncbi:unnamed protein product [Clavelina lepadiformis]|uniref:CCHC-type domain-containing protein n=1 Tax=Clavelina lepadiformis TaxID=159417 RepID=A0ABP0GYU7_CLALP
MCLVKASDAVKKHAFLQSLPEDMRFSMTDGRKELYELSYDELIQKAKDTVSGLSSQKHAMQQPVQRTQAKNIIENAERTHHEPRIMTSEVATVTGDHQDVSQLKRTVEKLQDEIFQLRKEMKTARKPREERRRLQCFNCGEYGHIARRCHRQRARNFRRASDIHGTHSNPPWEIYQVQTMDQDLHREQVFQR